MKWFFAVLLAVSFALRGDAAAYVVDVPPGNSAALRFVPISVRDFAVTLFGKRIATLTRFGNGRLRNPAVKGLVGRISRKKATVRCRRLMKGPAELSFKRGVLRSLRRTKSPAGQRDVDRRLVNLSRPSQVRLASLWPTEREAKAETRDWWTVQRGGRRLRLWYFNPNGAGTLFAELAVSALAVFLLWGGRKVKGGAALLCVSCLTLTFLTGSRGSLVAFGCGAAVLVLATVRQRLSRQLVVVVLLAGLVLAALMALGVFGSRFGSRLFALDWSNMERLRIWREVPRMLAAAPAGWGLNRSGMAYCDWFQPMGAFHPVKWLISSHLTWIVEFGRWFFAGYAFLWLVLLVLSVRQILGGSRLAVAALGILVLWFVAAWFSTVGIFVSLWILPSVAALAVLVGAVRQRRKADGLLIVLCGLLTLALPLLTEAVGCRMPPVRGCELSVVRKEGATVIGKGTPVAYVVPDDEMLTGGNIGAFGRDVRKYARRHRGLPAFAVVDSVDDLPGEMDRLVLCGRACQAYLAARESGLSTGDYPRAKTMVFLSPPFAPAAIPEMLTADGTLRVVYGEFARRLDDGLAELPSWCCTAPGAELYIPNWLKWVEGRK